MSDIVERLKGPRTPQGGLWPYPNLHDEAADEIEKLREELTAADNQAKVYSDEITRLRAALSIARPVIEAAERERCAKIVDQYTGCLPDVIPQIVEEIRRGE